MFTALLDTIDRAYDSARHRETPRPEPLEEANKATAHLYFSNPLHDHKSSLNNLFDTHPPVAERIRLLRAM